MGVWGPGIFDDDEAIDVRETYRDLVADEVPDGDAEQRVLDELADADGGVAPVVWPALAATQAHLGRLSDRVRTEALAVIDDGRGAAGWDDAPPADRRRRQAALAKLKVQLEGPPSPRRRVRREWKYRTDLTAGDVLSLDLGDGRARLLRVVGVDRDRYSDFPLLELLDDHGEGVPEPGGLERLPAARVPGPSGSELRWTVARNHRDEPDWADAGFSLVGRVGPRDGDAAVFEEDDDDEAAIAAAVDLMTAGGDGVGGDAAGRNTVHGAPFTTWDQMAHEVAEVERTGRYAEQGPD